MEKFSSVEGVVAPIDRPNVDTDALIPKQYLKSVERTGFGANLFDEWRYLDYGEPGDDHSKRRKNPDFILHQPRYENATILLARENFGCGSSREHAVWALLEYGFKVAVAPSFADIFYNNSFKNGFLPIVLDEAVIERLFTEVEANEGYSIAVDLEAATVTLPDGEVLHFDVEEYRRYRLLNGLDDIGLTLQDADQIRAYEEQRREQAPWLFQED